MEKLEFVDSVHEQRECHRKVIPCEGAWLETGVFTPIVESWDVKQRFLCKKADIDEKDMILTVELQELDVAAMRKASEEMADKVMAKHGEMLFQSLRFMICKGINKRRDVFEIQGFGGKRADNLLSHLEKSDQQKVINDDLRQTALHRIEKAKKDIEKGEKILAALDAGKNVDVTGSGKNAIKKLLEEDKNGGQGDCRENIQGIPDREGGVIGETGRENIEGNQTERQGSPEGAEGRS